MLKFDLTLKQLEIFRSVVIAGSITKASRIVGLSQPSISQYIAKLEETLTVQLLVRNRTGVISLTPAGDYWFKAGDQISHELNQFFDFHQNNFVHQNLIIKLGLTPIYRGQLVARLAKLITEVEEFSKFELHYKIASEPLVEHLRTHQSNMAIVSEKSLTEDLSSYSVRPLYDDHLLWAVHKSVPMEDIKLALKNPKDISTLAPSLLRHIEIDPNVSVRKISDEWYRNKLAISHARFSMPTYDESAAIVAEGIATTHLPFSQIPGLSPDVKNQLNFIDLEQPTNPIVLAMRNHLMSLTPYARIFRKMGDLAISWADEAREGIDIIPFNSLLSD